MSWHRTTYASPLLDDIHDMFPALLYDNGQFQTVPQVMNYITTQMEQHYDVFSTNRRAYLQQQAQIQSQQQQPQQQPQQPQQANTVPNPSTPLRRTNVRTVDPPRAPARRQRTSDISEDEMTGASHILDLVQNILGNGGGASTLTPIYTWNFTYPIPADLQPVEVVPTAEQLQANTTVSTLSENSGDVCSICQDNMIQGDKVRKLNSCSHTFHQNCVDVWFQRNVHCPTCRHDVRESSDSTMEEVN